MHQAFGLKNASGQIDGIAGQEKASTILLLYIWRA